MVFCFYSSNVSIERLLLFKGLILVKCVDELLLLNPLISKHGVEFKLENALLSKLKTKFYNKNK